MWPDLHGTANLVMVTEEILTGKLHFLYSELQQYVRHKKQLIFQRVRTFSHSTKLSKTSDLDHLTESLQAEEIPKRDKTLITYSCRTSSLKGYLRYKMITSRTVSSEAQVNNFILKKSYVPFLRYSSFCIFNHPMIYQICNIIISISAWARVDFWIYLLNHNSLYHQT